MPVFMSRYAIPLDEATAWQSAPERKRVIKTHFNWDLIPYSHPTRNTSPSFAIRRMRSSRVIFFVRDGVYGGAMPKVETWYRLFLSKNFMMGGSWADNAAGYWAQRHRPNVLVLSFKAMKKDLRGAVRSVAAFLDVNASDALIDERLPALVVRLHEGHRPQVPYGKDACAGVRPAP